MNRHCCLRYLFLLVFVGCYQMMVADTSHRIAQLRTNHIAHEKDQESGYDDRHARWYDDEAFNFLQTDPLSDHENQIGKSPYSSFWNNPIKHIDPDGKCPECPDKVYLSLAAHVYTKDLKTGMKTDNGWEVERVDLGKGGFRGALYKGIHNNKEEHIYAFQGTEPTSLVDWQNNLTQILKGESVQYNQAVNIALDQSKYDERTSYTGHSLGGGMASTAALKVSGKAVTFNAAGISSKTRTNLDITQGNANISAYVVRGEIVDYLQSRIGLKAEGKITTLPASYLPDFGIPSSTLGIINMVKRGINHTMDVVQSKFNQNNDK